MIELKIIHFGPPSPSDHRLAKLAEFMGITVALVPVTTPFAFLANGSEGRHLLLAGCPKAFEQLIRTPAIFERVKALFVYAPTQDPTCVEALSALTNGACTGVGSARNGMQRVSFSEKCEDITFQFTGLDFDYQAEGSQATFLTGSASSLRKLICLDGEAFFAQSTYQRADVLLVGASEIADIDGPFLKGQPVMQQFKAFIPAMMFLRKYAGGQCWHPSSHQAALVIDDPLVRPRYGYVNFAEIKEATVQRHYSASLAFIPWNYQRSDKKTAKLFQENADRLSISVHGCDHNLAEFGVTDEAQLCWKGKTALERMARHSEIFQTRFDKIMVFPQGIFSSVSMAALQRCGFEAVANATPHPVDKPSDFLLMRDMMEGALTRFSNFALFLRRSHHSIPIAAFDLFLGRPIVFFTHHEDFRDHGEQIGLQAERVNAFPGSVKWRSLGDVCARTSLRRFDENGNLHVRGYTDRFIVQNYRDVAQKCFFYRAAGTDPVVRVTVDGNSVPFEVDAGYVRAPFTLGPGSTVEMRLERNGPVCSQDGYHQSMADKASIFFRRHLSEFRANFVDTLDFAQPFVRKAGNMIHGRK